jgi:hypothetical protein
MRCLLSFGIGLAWLGMGWLSPRLFERGDFFVSVVLVIYLKREANCNDITFSQRLFNCL